MKKLLLAIMLLLSVVSCTNNVSTTEEAGTTDSIEVATGTITVDSTLVDTVEVIATDSVA